MSSAAALERYATEVGLLNRDEWDSFLAFLVCPQTEYENHATHEEPGDVPAYSFNEAGAAHGLFDIWRWWQAFEEVDVLSDAPGSAGQACDCNGCNEQADPFMDQ